MSAGASGSFLKINNNPNLYLHATTQLSTTTNNTNNQTSNPRNNTTIPEINKDVEDDAQPLRVPRNTTTVQRTNNDVEDVAHQPSSSTTTFTRHLGNQASYTSILTTAQVTNHDAHGVIHSPQSNQISTRNSSNQTRCSSNQTSCPSNHNTVQEQTTHIDTSTTQALTNQSTIFHSSQDPPTENVVQQNTDDNITFTESFVDPDGIATEYIGEEIQEPKAENTYRVYFSNPNGFKLDQTGGGYAEICEEMRRMNVDTWGAAETNVDSTRHTVKDIIHKTTRKHFEFSKICFGSSAIPSRKSFYKPGGTFLGTQGKTITRIVKQGTDLLGRWSYQVFRYRNNGRLTIISCYQVCKQQVRNLNPEGENVVHSYTATAQQLSMLRQAGRREEPRDAFIMDLKGFIKDEQEQHAKILLLGDFNESLEESNSGILGLISDCGLVDLLPQEHNGSSFGTHIAGSERIDLAFASESVANALRNCCYEPVHVRTRGDHRPIILDFDSQMLFGNESQGLASLPEREFTIKDKKAVREYIKAKHRYLTEHNFQHRLATAKTSWCEASQERLDADFQRAGFHAAKTCTKKPRDIAFVSELSLLRKRKAMLLKIISFHRRHLPVDTVLEHFKAKDPGFVISDNVESCQFMCNAIQRKITDLTRTAVYRRQNEQKLQLQEAEKAGDRAKTKRIKHMMSAERTKEMYKKIKNCRGTTKGGVTRLEVPRDPTTKDYNNCMDWISIDTPDEIAERLLQRNQTHFGQAHGTFPTVPPFSEWVDWSASSHTADLILEGNWPTDEVDSVSQDVIKHMRARTELDSVEDTLTINEWIDKIKTWPEATSTSPSGFHLTHSKALVTKIEVEEDPDETKLIQQQQQDLIEWQVSLLNLAIKNKYSMKRWQHIVNVMLLKEPGNHKIHRLRVIHLYEQDYNLILAVKWRKMLKLCSDQQLLHPEQFGGVPGRDAVLPTMLEEFQYEISRASKRPLIHLDYDATACYDRIVMNFGSLASRSFGQHRSIVFINASTLEQAKYYLKTQLGISERSYKHCKIFPIYGSGQGAGNSPAIWCVISCVLFDAYEERAHGATFKSPDGTVQARVFMIGFVDDTSGSTNDFDLPQSADPTHYIQLATHDAQRWNDVLSVSGGALQTTKCSYHFVFYTFTVDGVPMMQHGEFGPRIQIQFTRDTDPKDLKQISAYASHKTLGVHKAPSSTDTSLFNALKVKNAAHTTTMACSPFSRTDAWAYYHAVYLPSITYPFPSSSLSEEHCTKLQRQFKRVLLPKCGYNRCTPNAIVYGSQDFGGVGLRSLYTERGIAQVYALMACLRSEGLPCDLALIMISWGQFLAGTSFPILENTTTPLPHLIPMQWLPSLRDFLGSVDCRLEVASTFVPKLQRKHDSFLMDHAIQFTSSASELILVNACRLYLGVTFVSDISTCDGTMIPLSVVYGSPSQLSSPRGLLAYQAKPGKGAWTIWRRFLSTLLISSNIKKRKLDQPLGEWLATGGTTNRKWHEYLCERSARLFVLETRNYRIYKASPFGWFSKTDQDTILVPSDSVPVSSTVYPGDRRVLLARKSRLVSSQPSLISSFSQHIAALPPWELDMLGRFQILCSTDFLLQTLSDSHPLALCGDGSAPLFQGSFGCTCATLDEVEVFCFSGPAPGLRTSSFRAESYALLGLLRFMHHLCNCYGVSLPNDLCFYTDSKSLVDTVTTRMAWSYDYPYATMCSDWDLQQAIASNLRQYDSPPSIQHVKGHQDRYQPVETLSLPARLNVWADQLAGAYKYPPSISPNIAPMIAGTTVNLHCSQGTITSNFRSVLRRLASEPAITRYMCDKHKWSPQTFASIRWDIHGSVLRANFRFRHFLTKLVHDWLPLGVLKQHYATHYLSVCPNCPTSVETRDHFLRCPSRRNWLGPLIDELGSFWTEHHFDPCLRTILQDSIHLWISDAPMQFPSVPSAYLSLITRQTLVGWEHIFLGRFVQDWVSIQDSYATLHGLSFTQCSGRRLISGTIKILWNHLHDLWLRRNLDTHGHDAASRESAALHQAQREITVLYTLRSSVPVSDRFMFYPSTDDHFRLETTSIQLRTWINTWKPLLLSFPHSGSS